MGGHSYEEIMDTLTIIDSLVLAVLVLVLFAAAICIASWIKKTYVKFVRKEVERVHREFEMKNTAIGQHIKV